VFRLAEELGLQGWVTNSNAGVWIEVEGGATTLEIFLARLTADKPPRSFIQGLEASWLDPLGHCGFEIRESSSGGAKTALVLPDIATCRDCLADVFSPSNRRYFYPFTNCTNCGPRFTIVEALPYDRANTSMRGFAMCDDCRREYEDPRDRRFHAQPNACPVCGPRLSLWNGKGEDLAAGAGPREVLEQAAQLIRQGHVLAVKGLGGFHLLVSALDSGAVGKLRERKRREEKPFAIMFPSAEKLVQVCDVSDLERRLLDSPEAPIVLLRRASKETGERLCREVAPGNPNLGVMLPYTPLHHLLMSLLGIPVVATSGNLADEPICTDEREALERLEGIADYFLVHNRPIVRHVDDSILRVMAGRELVMRRARGFAPLPIPVTAEGDRHAVLALGAHLKNTVALGLLGQVFLSQHIGDLETRQAFEAFQRVAADLQRLYETTATVIAADLHPDYLSTQHARALTGGELPPAPAGHAPLIQVCRPTRSEPGKNPSESIGAPKSLVSVQHHLAHVLACMAENELEGTVLGVSWDGTGYGVDGTVWGGEFFRVERDRCERIGHLRTFRLPGGERAVREPRRCALGLLHEIFGNDCFSMTHLAPLSAFSASELPALGKMLGAGVNSPVSSSAGRLFDATASLIGLRQESRFEGQAAMELEFCASEADVREPYPVTIQPSRESGSGMDHGPVVVDWAPMIRAIIAELAEGRPAAQIASRFHASLAEMIVQVASLTGTKRVVLSGGCFQNRLLIEWTIERLRSAEFQPYWHQRVPPNDGGISLGQVVAALRAGV
jgi:hydrogenase maturation protein HypF